MTTTRTRDDAASRSVDRLLREARLPAGEARSLLAFASGRSREALIARPEALVACEAFLVFEALAAARRDGAPMAYLLGRREFHGRDFTVSPDVLIPRPETEHLVAATLDRLPAGRRARVLDLGTGSGAIAVTLALEAPGCDVTATDRSPAALAVARTNAARLGASMSFLEGDWFAALPRDAAPFDAIVSNPPYVAAGDPHLATGDLRFEPTGALTDGGDGLEAYRAIVPAAARHLIAGGWLLVEHGHDQAAAVRALFAAAGFADLVVLDDLAGIPRVTGGRWTPRSAAGEHRPPDL